MQSDAKDATNSPMPTSFPLLAHVKCFLSPFQKSDECPVHGKNRVPIVRAACFKSIDIPGENPVRRIAVSRSGEIAYLQVGQDGPPCKLSVIFEGDVFAPLGDFDELYWGMEFFIDDDDDDELVVATGTDIQLWNVEKKKMKLVNSGQLKVLG